MQPPDPKVAGVAHAPLEETRPAGHDRAKGLVSSRVSGDRVRARMFRPPADLADVVESLWSGRWDLRGQAPHVTELLGDPSVHVVFEAHASRVVGVWTRLWTRTLEGEGLVRAAKLRPGAVAAFFDTPAADLANRLTPLDDTIADRVLDPAQDEDAWPVLVAWLRARRRPPHPHVAEAIAVVRQMQAQPGLCRVEQVAQATGRTMRSLQRLFRDHVGAPPKWVLRRFRLQEVAQRVERGHAPDLTELALQLGYADQAHLARDFKAAVGRPLRTFERDLFRP